MGIWRMAFDIVNNVYGTCGGGQYSAAFLIFGRPANGVEGASNQRYIAAGGVRGIKNIDKWMYVHSCEIKDREWDMRRWKTSLLKKWRKRKGKPEMDKTCFVNDYHLRLQLIREDFDYVLRCIRRGLDPPLKLTINKNIWTFCCVCLKNKQL